MNENYLTAVLDKATNLVIALPVRPQLKTAHCVEILAVMAIDLREDKPELKERLSMQDGDTVFSVPLRMLQWFDEEARRRNIGAMDADTQKELDDYANTLREV